MAARQPVLVVAAHPDDEVLGCGGTIARYSKERRQVHIAVLGEGITSRYASREQADPALLRKLHANGRRVAKALGARSHVQESLPDNRFDTVALLDIVKIVESLVRDLKPELVFTHHAGDLNVDHRLVNHAVVTATRTMTGCPVKEILAFEIPSSTEWSFGQTGPLFRPNVFIDVSKFLETKIRALSLYEGELRSFPHPRSRKALEAIAHRWGSVSGCGAAEAFELVRSVR